MPFLNKLTIKKMKQQITNEKEGRSDVTKRVKKTGMLTHYSLIVNVLREE